MKKGTAEAEKTLTEQKNSRLELEGKVQQSKEQAEKLKEMEVRHRVHNKVTQFDQTTIREHNLICVAIIFS